MTDVLAKGRYAARFAKTDADIAASQSLRQRCFFGPTSDPLARDIDAFDPLCQHLMIDDLRDGGLAASCRVLLFQQGCQISTSYSAQFYDLQAIAAWSGPALEVGRFCLRDGLADIDALRLAWGALTRMVDQNSVSFLFGCSSFAGVDPAPYDQAFRKLARRHLAPADLRPGKKAQQTHDLATGAEAEGFDPKAAVAQTPPLLRSYLSMGGWVSDHAVVDRDLGTLHVLTGVEVANIPASRVQALRALAV